MQSLDNALDYPIREVPDLDTNYFPPSSANLTNRAWLLFRHFTTQKTPWGIPGAFFSHSLMLDYLPKMRILGLGGHSQELWRSMVIELDKRDQSSATKKGPGRPPPTSLNHRLFPSSSSPACPHLPLTRLSRRQEGVPEESV